MTGQHRGPLRDGLWRVNRDGICAGFVVENGWVTIHAPVLANRLGWAARHAEKVQPEHRPSTDDLRT